MTLDVRAFDKVVISGIRDLARPEGPLIVRDVIGQLARVMPHFIFGGARGVDTEALLAAVAVQVPADRMLIVVPATVDDQPMEARKAIYAAAQVGIGVEEMKLNPRDPRSYHERNWRMLSYGDRLVAFTDGAKHGGTRHTIELARKWDKPVHIVHVPRAPGGVD